jgi:hypothetical protein
MREWGNIHFVASMSQYLNIATSIKSVANCNIRNTMDLIIIIIIISSSSSSSSSDSGSSTVDPWQID